MRMTWKQKHFEESLERGLDFELTVIPILQKQFPGHVFRHTVKGPYDKNGPRSFHIYSPHAEPNELVLPDFEFVNPATNSRTWVDAKLKNKFYSTPQHRQYLTIDTRAHNDYKHTMSIYSRDDFLLVFGVDSNRKIYITPWNPKPDTIHFNNRYGNSDVPVYYKDQLIEVGDF